MNQVYYLLRSMNKTSCQTSLKCNTTPIERSRGLDSIDVAVGEGLG